MIVSIRVTNKTEALEAIEMLKAYTGVASEETQKEVAKSAVAKDAEGTGSGSTTAKKTEAPTKKTPAKKRAPKKEVEEDHDVEVTVTKAQLLAAAKEASARTDRDTVRETVAKYAPKISSVDEGAYEALLADLKAL